MKNNIGKFLFLLFAILLAIAAQTFLHMPNYFIRALFFYSLAILIISMYAYSSKEFEENKIYPNDYKIYKYQPFLILLGSIFACLTYLSSCDNLFKWYTAPFWFLSICLFILGFWQFEKDKEKFSINWPLLIIIFFILGIGAFFRFYKLDLIPLNMISDHAEKLLDINDILNGNYKIFFERNTGREPLQFYWTALLNLISRTKVSFLTLKIGSALFSFFTLPATYLLIKELFNKKVALLGLFFISISHWHVSISRLGLRAAFSPFFITLTLLFIFRAIKSFKRNDFLLAGLLMGTGFYTYTPSRAMPLLFILIIGYVWSTRNIQQIKSPGLIANTLLAFIVALIVFIPLGRYSIEYPDNFWYRSLTRMGETETTIKGKPILIFLNNLKNDFLMFNWQGDSCWPSIVVWESFLDTITGSAFILGFFFLIFYSIKNRSILYFAFFIAFVILMLPSALSIAFPNENPSATRTGSLIPLAAALAAIPFYLLIDSKNRTLKILGVGILIMFLIFSLLFNYKLYFEKYASQYNMNALKTKEMAEAMLKYKDRVGGIKNMYFVGWPYWVDGRAIGINLGDINWFQAVEVDRPESIKSAVANGGRLFLIYNLDKAALTLLRKILPGGKLQKNEDFLIYYK